MEKLLEAISATKHIYGDSKIYGEVERIGKKYKKFIHALCEDNPPMIREIMSLGITDDPREYKIVEDILNRLTKLRLAYLKYISSYL